MGDQNNNVDLGELRGTPAMIENKVVGRKEDDDLNGLDESIPDLKSKKNEPTGTMMEDQPSAGEGVEIEMADAVPQGLPADSKKLAAPEKETFHGWDNSLDPINDVLHAGDDVNSEQALSNPGLDRNDTYHGSAANNDNLQLGDLNNISSGRSLATATQTHEVRMPMSLRTFKPATGCTDASDFIVRCFVARLRLGIPVFKHGRSRWCKSRLRLLHIHPDGRSLSWKSALGEPHSRKKRPKLDLATCEEVRCAGSPDPQNPMYTGTPILRQKCEATNIHKSLALIFPTRTVDFTSDTADQCKVLMAGFSALCYRLQVDNEGTVLHPTF